MKKNLASMLFDGAYQPGICDGCLCRTDTEH